MTGFTLAPPERSPLTETCFSFSEPGRVAIKHRPVFSRKGVPGTNRSCVMRDKILVVLRTRSDQEGIYSGDSIANVLPVCQDGNLNSRPTTRDRRHFGGFRVSRASTFIAHSSVRQRADSQVPVLIFLSPMKTIDEPCFDPRAENCRLCSLPICGQRYEHDPETAEVVHSLCLALKAELVSM